MSRGLSSNTGGSSIDFNAVASRGRGYRVIERKVCEECTGPFYRDAPMRADMGERYCPSCQLKSRIRAAARGETAN